MRPFAFVQAADEARAVAAASADGAAYVAGGTTIVDLMRLDVMRPQALVDVTSLPLASVEEVDGGLRIGAMVRNSDLAHHPLVAKGFPALSDALLSGASPQLRNMATVGGNVMQRTRCPYFRDVACACNKRTPGAGCSAIGGYTRMHAVLGASPSCIAVHPSDMCVALVALDAVVHARGAAGATREIAMADFHTLPGAHPDIECVLAAGELITHVFVPATRLASRSHYLKVRDRASFAFALASSAVALDVQGGKIVDARVALGGVATKPWRSREAEAELVAKPPTLATFDRAAIAAMQGARAQSDNAFKIELGRRTIVRALREAAAKS
jgi:xanthine dehydrogenase YagS FAD-binding subunit